MMVEGSETHGGEGGEIPGRGSGRLTDADLLAERRARRSSESGEAALVRRAEAAEATVQTLERHVASLQQRLREAEEERRRMAELVEGERAIALERESELRRVKQREYAEQQLRVEAEDRLSAGERESRAEVERLGERLSAGERDLSQRLQRLERQLVEAEQAAAAERSALNRAESDLQARLARLERRAADIERGLEAERSAREQAETQLRTLREGNARIQGLVRDLRGVVARLGAAITATRGESTAAETTETAKAPGRPAASGRAVSPPATIREEQGPRPASAAKSMARDVEMAEALAAAVVRLRARAEAAPEAQDGEPGGSHEVEQESEPAAATPSPVVETAGTPAPTTVPSQDPPVRLQSVPGEATGAIPPRPSYKHSMSLIGRIRRRRKERRAR